MYAFRIYSKIFRCKFSTNVKPEYIDFIFEAQKLNLPKKNVAIFVQASYVRLMAEKDKKIEEICLGKDKLLAEKDKYTEEIRLGRDKLLVEKEIVIALINEKLADSNARYLQMLGDISIRRVIEMVEKSDFFQESKKKLKKKNPHVSRSDIWSLVLNQKDKCRIRFPNLMLLLNDLPPINLPDVISKLHNSASKGIHNSKIEQVLIDTSSLSNNEVKVAKALCKDWPIKYVTGDRKSLLGSLFDYPYNEEDEIDD